MYPNPLTQGQSPYVTEQKERGLLSAFKINLQIFNGLNAKFGNAWQYFHFDLNCGTGINEEVGCIGSPIAFIESARAASCENYIAGFCDVQHDFLAALERRPEVANNPRCFLFHGDNSSLLEAIPHIISKCKENPKKAIGTILSDPNGTGIPIDGLAWLSKECPKMDFVLNWNSTQFKRNRAAFGDDRPTMQSAIELMKKKHWLIREPMGKYQWTLLVGRNTPVGEHPTLGFYRLASTKGQEIFNVCNYTIAERPPLPLGQIELKFIGL